MAARFAPVMAGIGLGIGILAAPPAAAQDASAALADCATTSTGADGMLSGDLLQACLDRMQGSLIALPAEPETSDPEADEVSYAALDADFAIAVPVEEIAAEPVAEGPSDAFAALVECESGGDYGINTGNGYYGAYQFSLETWQGLGYGGYPHEASPGVQDQAARELQALYGWGQWPGCSWYLGLG